MVLKLAILAAAALMIAWMIAAAIQASAAIAVAGATQAAAATGQVCLGRRAMISSLRSPASICAPRSGREQKVIAARSRRRLLNTGAPSTGTRRPISARAAEDHYAKRMARLEKSEIERAERKLPPRDAAW